MLGTYYNASFNEFLSIPTIVPDICEDYNAIPDLLSHKLLGLSDKHPIKPMKRPDPFLESKFSTLQELETLQQNLCGPQKDSQKSDPYHWGSGQIRSMDT